LTDPVYLSVEFRSLKELGIEVTGPRWFLALRESTDFRRLWAAHLISSLGTGVTALAIPLVAAITLGASPVAVGILVAVTAIPHVLFSLVAGALVDRAPQRAILVLTDFGRAICLGLVPVLGVLGLLSMPILYCVVFLVQMQTVLNDLASTSVVPKVLPPAKLAAGNSAISLNESVAWIAGSGFGGGLVQLVGAAAAVGVDAVSYVFSGGLLLFLRSPDLVAARVSGRRGVLRDIKSGLDYVLKDRVLVALVLSSGIGAFAVAMRDASFVLALVRELHFSALLIGLLAAVGGVGGIIGGLVADWVTTRFGFGRSVIVSIATSAVAIVLLAAPFGVMPAVVVGVGEFVGGVSAVVYRIGQLTMRQQAAPREMLGRVNAARRFLVYALMPLGALVGGFGGGALSSRWMLVIAGVVMALSVVPLVLAKVSQSEQNE
jgi:MFS family permease